MLRRGFTLIELLVVIIIIGILAAVALPNFGRTKERALSKEASANLKLIAAAERIYRMETESYYQSDSVGDINTNLKLSLTGTNWTYSVAGGADNFTAQATRVGAGGCVYTFTSADAIAGNDPTPNASCP